MIDRKGNKIRAGQKLLCVSEAHSGEVLDVLRENRELVFPDCGSIIDCSVPLSEHADSNGVLQNFVILPPEKHGYQAAAKKYSSINLADAGVSYDILEDELNEEQTAYLNMFSILDDGVSVDILTVADADIEDVTEPLSYRDEDVAEDVMHTFLKEAEHYLVFANGCRWNGASGYKIVDNVTETIARDYDVSITPRAATKNGKVLVCRESSHDVPMGNTTVIVALTEKEYQKLRHADFDTVEKFAEANEAKAS